MTNDPAWRALCRRRGRDWGSSTGHVMDNNDTIHAPGELVWGPEFKGSVVLAICRNCTNMGLPRLPSA